MPLPIICLDTGLRQVMDAPGSASLLVEGYWAISDWQEYN